MSLRMALLALLSGRAMTGYDVAKHFHQSTGHVWHAPDSQIYPELRRMQLDGFLDVEEVPGGPRGTKKEYSVTDAGFEELRRWMNGPLEFRRQRDPAYLKAAYFEWAEPDAARKQLLAHIEHYEGLLQMLETTRSTLLDRSHPTLVRRLKRYPPEQHERIVRYKVFAYDGLVDQARREIEWARRGLELVDELSPDGDV